MKGQRERQSCFGKGPPADYCDRQRLRDEPVFAAAGGCAAGGGRDGVRSADHEGKRVVYVADVEKESRASGNPGDNLVPFTARVGVLSALRCGYRIYSAHRFTGLRSGLETKRNDAVYSKRVFEGAGVLGVLWSEAVVRTQSEIRNKLEYRDSELTNVAVSTAPEVGEVKRRERRVPIGVAPVGVALLYLWCVLVRHLSIEWSVNEPYPFCAFSWFGEGSRKDSKLQTPNFRETSIFNQT